MRTYFCILAVCRPPSDLCPAPSKDPTTLTTQEVTHHHRPQPQMKLCFPVYQTSLVLLHGSSMFFFLLLVFFCTTLRSLWVLLWFYSHRVNAGQCSLSVCLIALKAATGNCPLSQPGWSERRPRASPTTVSNLPCLPPPPRALAIHGATMATPPSLPRNRLDPAGLHGYGLL